jgi:hypothetical protein
VPVFAHSAAKKNTFLAAANPLTPGRYSSPQHLFALVSPYLQPTAIKELQHKLNFFASSTPLHSPFSRWNKENIFLQR